MIIVSMMPDPFRDWADRVFNVNDQLVSIVHSGRVDQFFDYHENNYDGFGTNYFIPEDDCDWSDFVEFNRGLECVELARELLNDLLTDIDLEDV